MGVRRLALAGVASAAFLVAGCSDQQPAPAASPAAGRGGRAGGQGPVPVTTASVVQKSMPVEINVIGSAEPLSTVAIRSQTTGQLTSVNFTEGDEVTKGQLLFSIDRRPLEAALEQAQANLARDEASAANAATISKRFQDLVDRGIATRAELDTSKASL